MPGRIPDIVFGFEFQKDRLKNVGAVGVEFVAFPLTWKIAYTTACCYRTSRDEPDSFIKTRLANTGLFLFFMWLS